MTRPALAIVLCALVVAGAGSATAAPRTQVRSSAFRFVDHTRTAHFSNGTKAPRTLVTYVHYPVGLPGPLPLIVFAHGYAVTPRPYAALLDAWARAGYVVAAPVFPVENAHAPGGPDERDLINQPVDMSFVITRLLAESASPASSLQGLIDPSRIAVAGQSDGGITALAVAYDRRFVDRRVRAAVILSGAALSRKALRFGAGSPPLLAVQGTADLINPAKYTYAFFRSAQRPKFLLSLLGAGHLPPYTTNARELGVVEQVTTSFLDHYLGDGSIDGLLAAGDAPGVARLTADP